MVKADNSGNTHIYAAGSYLPLQCTEIRESGKAGAVTSGSSEFSDQMESWRVNKKNYMVNLKSQRLLINNYIKKQQIAKRLGQ